MLPYFRSTVFGHVIRLKLPTRPQSIFSMKISSEATSSFSAPTFQQPALRWKTVIGPRPPSIAAKSWDGAKI